MRIALTGNPNSGKTTMYNALTGRNEKIGNWAGVTVDRKESRIKDKYNESGKELIAVDLPGAYSMSPFTSEESITSSYVKNEHPDAIINIVDATNLSRSLFFTTQLLELGIPVVVALNKTDVNDKKGNKIDEAKLSAKLGCPVIKTVSTSEKGIKDAVSAAAALEGKGQNAPYHQGDVDISSKEAVEGADRKRFDFVNAIVKDGTPLYANGKWNIDEKNTTLTVCLSEFCSTKSAPDSGLDNPFVEWRKTDRLLENYRIDQEVSVETLRKWAAENNGIIPVDEETHLHNSVYGE
jgi:small GTP-binding protein